MRAIAFILLAILPLSLVAQSTHYEDVPPGVWYEEEVQSFLADGYLDNTQSKFRAADPARRAEFMKLVVELNGGILDELPQQSVFHDVARDDWFFGYLEESAREGWVRGDGDCSGDSPAPPRDAPCTARPHAPITRAEAAVIIRRAFGKVSRNAAPPFADNPPGSWFSDAVQAAADHCIFRGDPTPFTLSSSKGGARVRPQDILNRAEMVVMLYRVDHGGRYPDCERSSAVAQ